jgi:hypothetical protein
MQELPEKKPDGTHKCTMCGKDAYPALVSAVKKQFAAREADELGHPVDSFEVECPNCECVIKVSDNTILSKLQP